MILLRDIESHPLVQLVMRQIQPQSSLAALFYIADKSMVKAVPLVWPVPVPPCAAMFQ
jgi:hypothetical protein